MFKLTKEDMTEIRRFNRNVDWIKRSGISVQGNSPVVNGVPIVEEWLTVKQAIEFVNRSRSWLQRITVTVPGIEHTTGSPMMRLFKGADWKRETSRILYKRTSLEALKKEMEKAGDRFDDRLAEKSV